jgi:hypothetical protein
MANEKSKPTEIQVLEKAQMAIFLSVFVFISLFFCSGSNINDP